MKQFKEKLWCIKDPDGNLWHRYIEDTRQECIDLFLLRIDSYNGDEVVTWKDARKIGFDCVKATLFELIR